MPTFAAVDIGANSVRLKIARLVRRRLRVIHEDRQVTRLGELVFKSPGGVLSPDSMSDTVKVLRRFHRASQEYGVDAVRVVATSALREAHNRQRFIDWVHSVTGWTVEIISGAEEARLIHLGVVSNLRISGWPALMVDLGGGSCELTISVRGQIRDTVSVPLGAVRLTNEFLHHDPPRKKELRQLRGFIDRELGRVSNKIIAARVKTVIATSGTAAALAAVAENLDKHSSGTAGSFVPARTAARIARLLARRTVEERAELQGIGPRRAEIVVAGAAVYAQLLERCRLRYFRYSPLGLRDGLLEQMAADYDRRARPREKIESERWESILAAAGHYQVDMDHAMQVRKFAVQLFRSMARLHQLPMEYEEWVSAAAILYEVGGYINRNGRHRHAYYILSHSEILGVTPQQRRIIAAIARYTGASPPLASDPPIKALPAADRQHVMRACLVLRLARALNLGRHQAVKALKIRLQKNTVALALTPKRGTDVELELWALERERAYFREVLGRGLSAAVA